MMHPNILTVVVINLRRLMLFFLFTPTNWTVNVASKTLQVLCLDDTGLSGLNPSFHVFSSHISKRKWSLLHFLFG
jgi:hypothetical protein